MNNQFTSKEAALNKKGMVMTDQFTKKEVADLFGKTVECIKTKLWSHEETDLTFDLFTKGEKAEVVCITSDHETNEVSLSLLVNNDYLQFNKPEFQEYCAVAK